MSKARTTLLLKLTSSKIPPLAVSLLFFGLTVGVVTLIFEVEGIALVWGNYETFAMFGLAFAYIIFTTRLIHNAHMKDYDRLIEDANLDDEQRKHWYQVMHKGRSQILETLIAIAVGLGHSYLQGSGRILTGESRFLYLDIWYVVQITLLWVLITQSTATFIRNMTIMNELSQKIRVDLLNMDKFMPLTRSGVWSILGFIGVYSIIFMQGIDGVSLANPAILVLGPSVFWMIRTPIKGLRKRIILAKETELAHIDKAIEGDREALKKSRISANLNNINVIDLINYKKMIQNTIEIPVNIPTASRFIFYLVIPLLTWIAASMVDKVIDWLIK